MLKRLGEVIKVDGLPVLGCGGRAGNSDSDVKLLRVVTLHKVENLLVKCERK